MPIFKQKGNKNIKCDNKTFVTLDSKHQTFIKEFENDEMVVIPQLKLERAQAREKKNALNAAISAGTTVMNTVTNKELMRLDAVIAEKSDMIQTLKLKKANYLKRNSRIIFEYFENKKNIDSSQIININKNKKIQSFFKIDAPIDDPAILAGVDKLQQNNTHLTQYLCNVDDNFIDVTKYMVSPDVCSICNKGELVPYEDEGILICNMCSHNFTYLVENEKPSYKETPKEISFYAYKRLNHFKEILAQFQAKETTLIDPEVIANIQGQIHRERIDLKNLTNETMRAILSKLNYDSKFYEHIPFIKHKMGIQPIIMSRELEDDLYNDFNELQKPYFRHCPENRENFLNYNYTAFKLCERRGHYRFLRYFNRIKDPCKLIEHDNIWEKICEDLGWYFIPTDYDAYDAYNTYA